MSLDEKFPPVFIIPTYRPMSVSNAITKYDEHFHNFGRKIDIIVSDDSPFLMSEKYYNLLEAVPTFNDLYYIGPAEKTAFVRFLCDRTGITMADSVINRTFRPSYGGNRNFTLVYTFGRRFISSDDDMSPGGFFLKERDSLRKDEVLTARYITNAEEAEYDEQDIFGTLMAVLGKKPSEVDLRRGQFVEDPNYDLYTNCCKNTAQSLSDTGVTKMKLRPLKDGVSIDNTVIKQAQTFRTGSNDLDSVEMLYTFLKSGKDSVAELTHLYAISAMRPFISKENWRVDCGVSGYDNTKGLPPFFPTRLRFEDYIYRLWSTKSDVSTAHVRSVQNHNRSLHMRPNLASDIYSELIAGFLKDKIRTSLTDVTRYGIIFEYDGTLKDSSEIEPLIEFGKKIDSDVEKALETEQNPKRKKMLLDFRENLRQVFSNFEIDHFMRSFSRELDEELFIIKDCMAYWQTIVEIAYFKNMNNEMPIKKVQNQRR